MALVPIRVDRTSKPPLGTPLRSDGHWSVQGLVDSFACNEGGGRTAFPSLILGNTPKWSGDGLDLDGATNYINPTPLTAGASEFCIILGINPTASSVYAGIYCCTKSGLYQNSVFGTPNGSWVTRDTSTGYSGARNNDLQYTLTLNKQQSLALRYSVKERDKSIYINGNKVTSSSVSIEAITSNCDSEYIAANASDGLAKFAGKLDFVFRYAKALTPDQIASLSANPWQIYEPETVWVEVGGGEMPVNYGSALMMGM